LVLDNLGGIERRFWSSMAIFACERDAYQAEADKNLEGWE
jgi:hypothetical protein